MIKRRMVMAGAAAMLVRPAAALAATAKPRVTILTGHGAIVVELENVKAPLTTTNFLHYVDAGKYDGGSFYRASRTPGAPRQGTIVGGPDARVRRFAPIAHESTQATGLRHVAGAISLGRYAPGTATADFFICASPEPYLDAQPQARPGPHEDNLGFAVFGKVTSGMAVVRTILALPTPGKSPFPDMQGQWLKPPVPILHMRRS